MSLHTDLSGRAIRRGLALAAALLLALVAHAGLAATADASHGRYLNLSYAKTGPNSVAFTFTSAWRADFGWTRLADDDGNLEGILAPEEGDIVNIGCINTGDGGSVGCWARVTDLNEAENYFVAQALDGQPGDGDPSTAPQEGDLTLSSTDTAVDYTYPQPTSRTFNASHSGCCTISNAINYPDSNYSATTLVNLDEEESPVSNTPPIVDVGNSGEQVRRIIAQDPDAGVKGRVLRYRLSYANPAGMTIDSDDGEIHWDTTGVQEGLYFASVRIEQVNTNANDAVEASEELVFLIRVSNISGPQNGAPAWVSPPTPTDGVIYTITPGSTLDFDLHATDPDGDPVSIGGTGVPTGASLTQNDRLTNDGDPAKARFSWTPAAEDLGREVVIAFSANDDEGAGASFRTITVRVGLLSLAPADSVHLAGEQHEVTAKLIDTELAPREDATIRFTVQGANPGSGEGVTDENGQTTYSYTGGNTGVDTIIACADSTPDTAGCEPDDPVALARATFQGAEGPAGDPTCSDSIDNDGDGNVDGDDDGCRSTGQGTGTPPGNPFVPPLPDTEAPDTFFTLTPGDRTAQRQPLFDFASTEPLSRFSCQLDGTTYSPCLGPWLAPPLSDGEHTFSVFATDRAGNDDLSPATHRFEVGGVTGQSQELPRATLGRVANVKPVDPNNPPLVGIRTGARNSAKGARIAQAQGKTIPGIKGVRFVPLTEARQIPIGSFLDTRDGAAVDLTTAAAATGNRQQTARFFSGVFQVLQARRRNPRGLTDVRLKGGSFRSCSGTTATAAQRRKTRRRLWGDGRGRFRTRGRYAAATVRGTRWLVSDRCDGTLTRVSRGTVTVRDFRKRRNITVTAGKQYIARRSGNRRR